MQRSWEYSRKICYQRSLVQYALANERLSERKKKELYDLLNDMAVVMSFGWKRIFQWDELLMRELADNGNEDVYVYVEKSE